MVLRTFVKLIKICIYVGLKKLNGQIWIHEMHVYQYNIILIVFQLFDLYFAFVAWRH